MTSTDKTKGPIVKVDLHCEDINVEFLHLTEVAGEGGPDLAPQKFLLSQKFRHLMG